MFVRLFVDENLDRLVPISKQPKEKILAIIQSCNRQFPEFRDRARKRIRTYLKSCRRLKKLKEPLKRAADQMVSKNFRIFIINSIFHLYDLYNLEISILFGVSIQWFTFWKCGNYPRKFPYHWLQFSARFNIKFW